jgi:hypothetical protein
VQADGVEVLARGPVHEAFAEPAIRAPRPTPLVPKAPPDPVEELPPDQKPEGDNVQWIPGYWAWDDERNDYLWVSGTWRAVPPDREWLPGHWNQATGGWQWVAGFWQPRNQGSVEFLPPPPDPMAEAVTAAPSRDDVYVPGTWVFHDTRYMWRPGFWLTNRPGWVWVPAQYLWTPRGYLFVDGYWDFPLANRGLLFAPVWLAPGSYVRPGWVYRPAFVVDDQFLTSALFVRLADNHYYFGDYFDPRYARSGFTAWVDIRISRFFFDPLFAYYRWRHRGDPAVERDLLMLYAARREGRAPRPPQTLVQQQSLVKNGPATGSNAVPLVSLTEVKAKVKTHPVPAARAAEQRKEIQQIRDLSRARAAVEGHVLARKPSQGATPTPAAPVKVELPHVNRVTSPAASTTVLQPPPLPPAVVHSAAKPSSVEVKPVVPGSDKPVAGERPPVVNPETKPVRPADRPTAVKPEPKPLPADPKPAPKSSEAKPAPKPVDAKPAAPSPPKPAEAKPAPKPVDAKPAAPSPPKPTEAKPAPSPSAPKPADARPMAPSAKPSETRQRQGNTDSKPASSKQSDKKPN